MALYHITVSFGDGNPHRTTIEAKSGADAHDRARKTYVNARCVYVLGVVSDCVKDSPSTGSSLIYGCDLFPKSKKPLQKPRRASTLNTHQRSPLVAEVLRLRHDGLSQAKIAEALGVTRAFVRRTLKVPA